MQNDMDMVIEVDGKKYRRHYYNTCVRCALLPGRTGKPCPVHDCIDGNYFKEVKQKQ